MRSFFLALGAIAALGMSLAWAESIESVRDLAVELKNERSGRLCDAAARFLQSVERAEIQKRMRTPSSFGG